MNREIELDDIGGQLGTEGIGGLVSNAEAYCACESRRIVLTNEPRIIALQKEGSLLMEEKHDIVGRLRLAPPPGDLKSRRRKALYYCMTALFLTVSAFVFSLYSFEPFGLGIKSYLYCLGVAVVVPMLTHMTLQHWNAESFIKYLTTIACVAGLGALVLLAVIRGNLMAEALTNSTPAIVLDDAPAQPAPAENTFYEKSIPLLVFATCLLAIAMDLGAGLALHEASRMNTDSPEDWDQLRKQLVDVRKRMVALVEEITALQNEAEISTARFWRNFYHAMLTHTIRSAMAKFVIVVALLAFGFHGQALAQGQITLVIAVDLTKSVDVRGPDGKTEFQKNIDAVGQQLAQVSAGTRIVVIGITDHSFTEPDILFSATVDSNPDYFGERLNHARNRLVEAWIKRSSRFRPVFRSTDIIGALMLAEQIFDQQSISTKQTLIIYSDMRQHTGELDIETESCLPTAVHLLNSGAINTPNLQAVEVQVFGADAAGKEIAFWQQLHMFWGEYFHSAKAMLSKYSAIR